MTALQIVKDNLSSCLMFSFLQDKYSYFLSYVMRHNIQAPHRPGSSPRDQIWLIFLVSTVQVRFDQQSRGETTSIFLLVILAPKHSIINSHGILFTHIKHKKNNISSLFYIKPHHPFLSIHTCTGSLDLIEDMTFFPINFLVTLRSSFILWRSLQSCLFTNLIIMFLMSHPTSF